MSTATTAEMIGHERDFVRAMLALNGPDDQGIEALRREWREYLALSQPVAVSWAYSTLRDAEAATSRRTARLLRTIGMARLGAAVEGGR